MIDPTWSEAEGQTTYTDLLRRQFPEKDKPEKERRLDILGVTVGGELSIVELKRPEKTLSREDLEQIERYVDWATTQWQVSGGTEGPRMVSGRLIVGKRNTDAALHKKEARLTSAGITVLTYRDLLQRARNIYGKTEKKLQRLAPEYSRAARRSRSKKAAPAKKAGASVAKHSRAAKPKRRT